MAATDSDMSSHRVMHDTNHRRDYAGFPVTAVMWPQTVPHKASAGLHTKGNTCDQCRRRDMRRQTLKAQDRNFAIVRVASSHTQSVLPFRLLQWNVPAFTQLKLWVIVRHHWPGGSTLHASLPEPLL